MGKWRHRSTHCSPRRTRGRRVVSFTILAFHPRVKESPVHIG